MRKLSIIVDDELDWAPYYPTKDLVSAEKYLFCENIHNKRHTQVINLCRAYDYLSAGYYCSLLAEARGQSVIPSVRTLVDLINHQHYQLYDFNLEKNLAQHLKTLDQENVEQFAIKIFFGQTPSKPLANFARHLFERYTCPILVVDFEKHGRWNIAGIRTGSLAELNSEEQDQFGSAIDSFSRKIWRKPRSRRNYRYDLAILHDPAEKIPTSNKRALKKFIAAGNELGLDVELIEQKDFSRLLEYDALFIRETTAINHHTYRFSKHAENNGLVVIDDPDSILRCTNKVFLYDLLTNNNIPTPQTRLIMKSEAIDYGAIGHELGYPLVLKIPDGSFSVGIEKAPDERSFIEISRKLFERSAILLVQEFIRTDFDWRIGILNNRPIYACKYIMARGHWQIYDHSEENKIKTGGYATFGIHQVPKDVIKTAVRATRLIGNGLYGVDIKTAPEGSVVIEVNDNPSIDAGVEDEFLGDELYRIIMSEFARRLDQKRMSY